jgi:Na+-driven multidrug efflux pump
MNTNTTTKPFKPNLNEIMKYQKIVNFAIVLIAIAFFSSCASSGYTSSKSGFFSGLIHGFVFFPFAILAKIFGMDYDLYASNNSGLFYWIGFIIGLGGLGSGGRSLSR